MSEAGDWQNLNPDESSNSNFYYNPSEQQFALSPVYKREDLPLVLSSLKSKCNFLNFDYLGQMEAFKDLLPHNEKENLPELGLYAEDDLFLSHLQQNIEDTGLQIRNEDPILPVHVRGKNSLKGLFLEQPEKKEEVKEEVSEINLESSEEEEEPEENEEEDQEELTFKDLKNFNFPKAYGYRLTDEEQLSSINFSQVSGYFSLLRGYLSEIFKENINARYKKKEESEDVICEILVNGEFLVELEGKSERKCSEKVSQLLLAFFAPGILKLYQENKEKTKQMKRKKVKREGLEYKDFGTQNLSGKEVERGPRKEISEIVSNDSREADVRNYKALLPKRLNEEELRALLDDVLMRRTFSFSNFLSEMKMELLKTSANKERKALERETMKKCLNTFENLFRYYKLVLKQKTSDNILIFSHYQEGEFKATIMEQLENGDKKLISYGCNTFKSFALYFALNNFFENHLKGSYCPINQVYDEIKKMDSTCKNIPVENNNSGPLDLISQDLLNEIDNYAMGGKKL